MKTKLWKKTSMLVLAIALIAVSVLPLSVFAAPDAATPPTSGTLVIHKYKMDDLSGAIAHNGTELNAGDIPATATPLDGIEFTIQKVLPKTPLTDVDGTVYPATPEEAAQSYIDSSFTARVVTTAGGGLATVGTPPLPQGVYLVTETNSTVSGVTYSPSQPFLVAVPMTNPTGNGWLQTVHVYPKNQSMVPEKTVSGDPSISKTMTWEITVPIPTGGLTDYKITDIVDSRLIPTPSSTIDVYTVATKATATASGITVPAANYTAGWAGNTLTVHFSSAEGLKFLEDSTERFIRVVFKTDLTDAALGLLVKNDAELSFKNDKGTEYKESIPKEDQPFVYTGTVGIEKLTKNSAGVEQKLSGAVFKIATTEANAKAGTFLKNIAGTADLVSVETPADSGFYEIRGIPYGSLDVAPDAAAHSSKTYWLVEVQAPAGYNLLDAPIEVSFKYSTVVNNAGAANEETVNYFNADMMIYNNKGFTLPGTGAAGIVISTIIGIVLLASVILIVVRRKSRKVGA